MKPKNNIKGIVQALSYLSNEARISGETELHTMLELALETLSTDDDGDSDSDENGNDNDRAENLKDIKLVIDYLLRYISSPSYNKDNFLTFVDIIENFTQDHPVH